MIPNVFNDWVRVGKERGASDLHLEAGTPVVYRIRGEIVQAGAAVPGEALLQAAKSLLGPAQWSAFVEQRSADISRTIQGTRCRINVFQTVRGVGFAIRILSSFQNTIRDCNLHPDLKNFIEAKHGLLLISGPTGSGKSTTLAAFIEEINRSKRKNIIVVESPIEYFFANRQSFVRQREVPLHSPSFEQALVDSMRENPDVLVIGEMRTPDVMRLTLNAAETGHLVIATVHSTTCAEALSRICMSFPAEIQASVRAQLADCLNGVICQRLMYLPQVGIQVPHCEILAGSSAVKATVRSGQFSHLATAIQSGGDDGSWSFDRYARWIEQKRDWVRPSQAQPLAVSAEESALETPGGLGAELAVRRPPPLPSAPPSLATARGPVRSPVARPPRPAPAASSGDEPPTAERPGRFEIQGDEDLGDLESLVKKISDEDSEP